MTCAIEEDLAHVAKASTDDDVKMGDEDKGGYDEVDDDSDGKCLHEEHTEDHIEEKSERAAGEG